MPFQFSFIIKFPSTLDTIFRLFNLVPVNNDNTWMDLFLHVQTMHGFSTFFSFFTWPMSGRIIFSDHFRFLDSQFYKHDEIIFEFLWYECRKVKKIRKSNLPLWTVRCQQSKILVIHVPLSHLISWYQNHSLKKLSPFWNLETRDKFF